MATIAQQVFTNAAQVQTAWEAGRFTRISRTEAAKRGYDGCETDPFWFETDELQALTGAGIIEVYVFQDDDEPLRFQMDHETGEITRY